MLKGKIDALRDYIKRYNPYFLEAFSDVYQDDTTGIVHNNQPIFPADNLGDYFYLRLPNNFAFQTIPFFQVADGINGVGLSANIILVACAMDCDEDKMITNLVNTVQSYDTEYITLNSVIYQPEIVLAQELSRLSEENISAALQRLDDNYSIVCVNFTLTVPFVYSKPSCITKPCKEC